ncbi:MAG: MFS transporter [Candidatus Micrarchaeota archaeon]
MAKVSKLVIIHILYSFLAAAMAVLIPLYLVDQEVDIASIGIILSTIPLTFMLLRVVFASMADSIGTKTMGTIYSIANMLAIVIYSLTASSIGFIAGTMVEGVRNSGFWAISRTEVLFHNGKDKAANLLAYFGGVRQVADGFGRLSVGFLIAFLTFQKSFILLFALSFVMFVLIVSLNKWKLGNIAINKKMVKRILNNRPRSFWFNALGLTSMSITSNMLLAFLLPLYAYSHLGFSYEETGLMVALFSLLTGIIMMLVLKKHISGKKLMSATALMVPALIVFPFIGSNIIYLVFLLAIGNGCSIVLSEYILADAVSSSDEISTDIGLIYMPLRIAEFVFLFLGGFVIVSLGYAPLFFICSLCVLFFLLFARNHFK